MSYLEIGSHIGTILGGFSVFFLVIQVKREIIGQNTQALIYIHSYLSQEEFSKARFFLRTQSFDISNKDHKNNANKICSSYDQAGILLSLELINKKTKENFYKSSWGESVCHQYETLRPYLDSELTPTQQTGRQFFHHFSDLYNEAKTYHRKKFETISIFSGGQTGVDRAALDVSINNSINYSGWCPKGGWAEDMPDSPGVLTKYPNLNETNSIEPDERTERNVRESDATLIIQLHKSDKFILSKGTKLTKSMAQKYNKQMLIVFIDDLYVEDKIWNWLLSLKKKNIVLNIAGPRESESPGIYNKTAELLNMVFAKKPISGM